MKLLLANGVTLPLWNNLTTTGIIEGRGRMLATITAPDFQPLVEEDISETATAHLNKGLFVAHGLDEGGDGVERRRGARPDVVRRPRPGAGRERPPDPGDPRPRRAARRRGTRDAAGPGAASRC